jgi:Transmembrane domain of unknown function (DUF3566)
MRHRIARIGVLQTATMFGALYAALGLCFLPFMYAMLRFSPMPEGTAFPFGGRFILFLPIIYGVIGFVFSAIAAAIYNVVAMWVGGFEIELTEVAPATPGPS